MTLQVRVGISPAKHRRRVRHLVRRVPQRVRDHHLPAVCFCNTLARYANIHDWILYTPEFQQIVMIIASPCALLLALWYFPAPNINNAFVY
jgi:hypothetical protein